MKKKITIIIAIILLLGLYLNRAYAHIYSTIGTKNLVNPTMHQNIIISPSSTSIKKIVYLALGDSLTAGTGATSEEKTYPYLLSKSLAEKENAEVTLINLGIPGATAQDVLQQEIPSIKDIKPDFVTLAIGVNDVHDKTDSKKFKKEIEEIIDILSKITKNINIINIPYIGNNHVFLPPYQYFFDKQTIKYNSLLSSALKNRQIYFIDIYSQTHETALHSPSYYADDGFHPSDEGYNLWSKIIYDNLHR